MVLPVARSAFFMLKELLTLALLLAGLATGVVFAIARHVAAAAVRHPFLFAFLVLDIYLIRLAI
jgi:hypothetical protein